MYLYVYVLVHIVLICMCVLVSIVSYLYVCSCIYNPLLHVCVFCIALVWKNGFAEYWSLNKNQSINQSCFFLPCSHSLGYCIAASKWFYDLANFAWPLL